MCWPTGPFVGVPCSSDNLKLPLFKCQTKSCPEFLLVLSGLVRILRGTLPHEDTLIKGAAPDLLLACIYNSKVRLLRWEGPFPLTPALSLGERENFHPAVCEPEAIALFEERAG